MMVSQLERYVEGEVREQYLRLKQRYLEEWDKVKKIVEG